MPAPFFVLEALDAGGSQTQTDLLSERFKKEGYTVSQFHFPQEDQATGRLIYDKFLLTKNKPGFSRREQALLYIQDFFSRADDLKRLVNDTAAKSVIISDRFCTSTMAYQTIGLTGKKRRDFLKWVDYLCYQATPVLPKPTAVIFLDTPVDVSLRRLKGKKKDYHENKTKLTAFHRSYTKLAKEQKWLIFSSVDEQGRERTREAIHDEIWQKISPLLV